MIVSINPFRFIQAYGEQLIPEYQNNPASALPPHLYAIAQQAYNSVLELFVFLLNSHSYR